jgi:hypothetical protein
MTGQPTFRSVLDTQQAAARDLGLALQDEHASWYGDLLQLALAAERQWRTASETYFQDVRAASAGDDVYQRASAAYRTLQREHARIQAEYAKACQERWARLSTSLGTLTRDARVKAIDGWIEHLQQLRQAMSAGEAAAGPASQGKGR